MQKRVDPEIALKKEHAAREVQRAGTFILTIVLAGLVMALAAVPQIIW